MDMLHDLTSINARAEQLRAEAARERLAAEVVRARRESRRSAEATEGEGRVRKLLRGRRSGVPATGRRGAAGWGAGA